MVRQTTLPLLFAALCLTSCVARSPQPRQVQVTREAHAVAHWAPVGWVEPSPGPSRGAKDGLPQRPYKAAVLGGKTLLVTSDNVTGTGTGTVYRCE